MAAAFVILSYTCGRCVPIASNSNTKELEINEQIRDKEIRLIGADGAQMGIMSPRDALRMAIDRDLDLVKIAPQAKPPVCKILDYGKYRFEMQKREKEAKKNQKVVELKEIRRMAAPAFYRPPGSVPPRSLYSLLYNNPLPAVNSFPIKISSKQ